MGTLCIFDKETFVAKGLIARPATRSPPFTMSQGQVKQIVGSSLKDGAGYDDWDEGGRTSFLDFIHVWL